MTLLRYDHPVVSSIWRTVGLNRQAPGPGGANQSVLAKGGGDLRIAAYEQAFMRNDVYEYGHLLRYLSDRGWERSSLIIH